MGRPASSTACGDLQASWTTFHKIAQVELAERLFNAALEAGVTREVAERAIDDDYCEGRTTANTTVFDRRPAPVAPRGKARPSAETSAPRRASQVMLDWLPHKAILAPMEGVGHPVFRRRLAEQPGLGMLCTEFVRVHDGLGPDLPAKHFERSVVKVEGILLSVQVMGRERERMAEAAEIVEAAGADAVDINLGCPTARAVKGGVGAAMLKDLVLLEDVLCSMRERVQGRLSAKIRAGFDSADQALEIAAVVERAGCDYLAVHPRKRSDQYRGVSDLADHQGDQRERGHRRYRQR